MAQRVAAHGGILGAFAQGGPELAPAFDRLLALAAGHGLDVDCHLDETLDPASTALRTLAEAALRQPLLRPDRRRPLLLAGHPGTGRGGRARSTSWPRAASRIVSLPMCNLYLQDRAAGRTPRRRGLTLVHEIRARGISSPSPATIPATRSTPMATST